VNGAMCEHVAGQLRAVLESAGLDPKTGRVEPDSDDLDQQSLLIWYPKVTADDDGYIRPAVKIESGAKSALDPNQPTAIRPYVTDVLAEIDLSVPGITTVIAERTSWDKAVILHGLRQWFERRGVLRGGGQRVSRHYYDVYCLLERCRPQSGEGSRSGRRLHPARPNFLQQPRSQSGGGVSWLFHAFAKPGDGRSPRA
jgi:Nucleotidyl transferase AbiEii toxin, Type IV TA system